MTADLRLGAINPVPAPASSETPEAAAAPRLRGPIIVGITIVVLFFGVLGGWSAVAPLASASIAPGVVGVDTKRKTIQHLEGGIVGEILVTEGDEVRAGQVLIRLDETRPRATLELLRGRQLAALAFEARLIAERDGEDAVRFPATLTDRANDPKVMEAIVGQTEIFEARRRSVRGQISILNQRVAQFEEEITGLKAQIAAEDRQLQLIVDEIKDVGGLVEKGLARLPRLRALQRPQAEIEGSRSNHYARIARARQNIGENKLRINELRTAMVNEVVEQLRTVQDELLDIGEHIRAAEDVLQRTDIRAPQDGIIVGLQVHTTGGVIGPGEPLLDIVPSSDRLVVEAQVDPADIDVVYSGLEAEVRFSAFSSRYTVPVKAKVTSVSADRFVDERMGTAYYTAKVELTEDPAEVLDGGVLQPGMQAEVMILTGDRTALSYLMRPLFIGLTRAFREN